jgi:RNA polymerase sigma factor (sigma-70 family)
VENRISHGMSDSIEWQKFQNGDKDALSGIFLSYHDDLFRYGLKLSLNQDIVEDCIQDLFLKLWKNRQRLKQVEHIKSYLLRSLRNHLHDSLELSQNNTTSIDNTDENIFQVEYSPEDFLINSQVNEETRNRVIEALNQLSPRQREAIYLRYFEEMDFETIAHVMEMNVQSVRNTIFRGMQVMRDLMLMTSFLVMIGKEQFPFSDCF